jgi:flagellar assembly protein FliH
MGEAAKFLFDVAFDAPGEPHADAAPGGARQRSNYSAAEHEVAVEAAMAAGRDLARAETESKVAALLSSMAGQLGQLGAAQRQVLDECRREAMDAALAIAGKLAPVLLKREPAAEVEGLIRECLAQVLDEPRIVVRAAPAVVDILKPKIDALAGAQGFTGKIVLFPDDALPDADCRVEWASGGAEHDRAAILARCEAVIARYDAARTGARPPAAQPSVAAPPIESPRPGTPAPPIEVSKPVEAAAPIEAAARLEAAKPIAAAEPREAAKPVEAAAPVEVAKPAEAADPSAPVEPTVAATPSDKEPS